MTILKDKYPLFVEQAIQWGEMDAFNHVNNSVYFKYFENARIKFMAECGVMEMMKREKVGPILARIEGNFKLPLTYPDTIRTYIRVKSIGHTSFVVEHAAWSRKHDEIACIGEGVLVVLDYKTNEKIAISEQMRANLERYM